MSTPFIRLAVSDEDRARLDELVQYFGVDSRSAYLRATLKVMESIRRADTIRELQARSRRRLAEMDIIDDKLDDLISEGVTKT